MFEQSGPCDAVKPTWNRMNTSIRKCMKRVGFYGADQEQFKEKFKALAAVSHCDSPPCHCESMPATPLWSDKPPPPPLPPPPPPPPPSPRPRTSGPQQGTHFSYEPKGCAPIFVMLRKCALACIIYGADSPKIEAEVDHFMPPEPSGDEE